MTIIGLKVTSRMHAWYLENQAQSTSKLITNDLIIAPWFLWQQQNDLRALVESCTSRFVQTSHNFLQVTK